MMLVSYFKLANKSYLIHMFWYDLIRFFIILKWLTFLGHPVQCNHAWTVSGYVPNFST